mgnify:CR=1 FL=1
MQNKIVVLVIAFLLTACMPSIGNMESKTADATYGPLIDMEQLRGPLPTSTPAVDEVGTAMMVLAKDAATSTSEAQATGTAYVVTGTAKAESTQAFWAGVTLAVGTQRATETQIAKTSVAGTEQANWQTGVPLTSTMIEATKIIEHDQLNAERVSIWVNKVSGSVFLLGIVLLGLFLLYKGVRFGEAYGNAKSLQSVTSALKADEHGRLPLVPESSIPGGKLINPNLMHRATLDTKADDLTPEQALGNTSNLRRLEAVRSVSKMPILRGAAKDLLRDDQKPHEPKPADVKITKPDLPALPELPAPNWKLLNKWDGELLPVGADEKGELLRIDPAQRAHLMYVGRSGTGKSLTGIRTEVACLLTQGWNVICMGKRVDFMPFEDHPNFKLIAVDVRKDAGKYVEILNTLTAQMDVRDQLMAARNVSTWERYGAPETMIVLDDYSGAMMRMDKKFSALVLNEVKQIAMDGRKFGLHLTIGLQRATWENIDTDLRSQMGRIVFSVESASDSRIALGANGAELLPAFRHFLTRMSDGSALQRGIGFFLEDAEVEAFLASRPVAQNEPMQWVDGKIKEPISAPVTGETQPPVQVIDVKPPTISVSLEEARQKADETMKIQDLYIEYLNSRIKPNLAEIERKVYGKTGGSFHHGVKKAIALFEGVTVEEVNAVIEKHVASWSTTPGATTDLNGSGSLNFGENPA